MSELKKWQPSGLDSYTETKQPPLDLSLAAGFNPPRTRRIRSQAESLSQLENLAYGPVRMFRRALVYCGRKSSLDGRK